MKICILGGGLAGCTLAYYLNKKGHNITIIEKNKIGGMCRTEYIDGLAYEYGPHIIYTNDIKVKNFFQEFVGYKKNIFSLGTFVENQFIPYPPQLNYIKTLPSGNKIIEELSSLPETNYDNFETYLQSTVGNTAYELFFKYFTEKFWNIKAKNLSSKWAIVRDLRIRENNIPAFNVKYQGYPETDYTDLCYKLTKDIRIIYRTIKNFDDISSFINCDFYINTISLDNLFDYEYGKLPYRGFKLRLEVVNREHYLPNDPKNNRYSWIYYPEQDFNYTRVCEYKNINLKENEKTLIGIEFPNDTVSHYPFYTDDSELIFNKYLNKIIQYNNLITLGRLGLYTYTTMSNTLKMCWEIEDIIDNYSNMNKDEKKRSLLKIREISKKGA